MKKLLRIFGLQRWIRLGLRYRLILPRPFQDIGFTAPFFGYEYSGTLNDYIDRYVYFFGAYEREELALLEKYIKGTVIDIGANTGHHSLYFSRFADRVYSFEPYKKVFDVLNKRLTDNKVANVQAFNFGLGNKDEFLDFYAPFNNNEGVGSFIPDGRKTKVGTLEIKRGDSFLSANVKEKIGFIKIDVEGFEIEVLEGLSDTISKHRPVLFVEMSPESQKRIPKLENYSLFRVDANHPFLMFFNIPGGRKIPFTPMQTTENILFVPNEKV